MKINITARKFKARETLKEFIETELSSLEKFNDEIQDVEVILSFQPQKDGVKSAEIIVKIPGSVMTSHADGDEFEIAVRAALDKMLKQLTKVKSKKEPKRG